MGFSVRPPEFTMKAMLSIACGTGLPVERSVSAVGRISITERRERQHNPPRLRPANRTLARASPRTGFCTAPAFASTPPAAPVRAPPPTLPAE